LHGNDSLAGVGVGGYVVLATRAADLADALH
jgi:hypothetical protein